MRNQYTLVAIICTTLTSCGESDYIPSAGAFQAGRVFNVTSSDGTVYIQLWDDECEDGDIIDIQIANFYERVELTKTPKTIALKMNKGTYEFFVLAINGTGYKGSCSFADSNTHAVTVWADVSGKSSNYYTYTSKSGAGTRHNIKVTIP